MALIRRTALRRLLLGLAVGAFIVVAVWLTADWLRERRKEASADVHVQEILSMLNLASLPDFHERLDRVRGFVNDHSKHKIDKAFGHNRGNPNSFLVGLLAHAKGTAAEPVHMECSTRTSVMGRILQALGYNTRIVAVFDSNTNLKSHSFLEVLNPETRGWETTDADYDIYWRSKDSGTRISLAEMAQSIDDIEPCGRHECGWDVASREGIEAKHLIRYLDIISITARQKAVRYALYTSRTDLDRTYRKGEKRGSFCEVEAKRCKRGFYDITQYSTYEPGLLR
jgi:hypothetical protein